MQVESWTLTKVLKPSIPYFVSKFRACSKIKLLIVTKLYFAKALSNNANIVSAYSIVLSLVLTRFHMVELNSTLVRSDK